MSDNLDFMAIFGGEGNLDLGSGGEDFDALFAEKETTAPQPPEEKVPETTETAQPEKAPAETPEPEEKKENANVPEEKSPKPRPNRPLPQRRSLRLPRHQLSCLLRPQIPLRQPCAR